MLQVFSTDVYDLLEPGSTLSFVSPLIACKFDIFPDIFNEPFAVTSPVGKSIVARKVYRNFPIMLPTELLMWS